MACNIIVYFNKLYPRIVSSVHFAAYKLISRRYSSYQNSKNVENFIPTFTDYETSRNPGEWKFVERLLAPQTVPKPSLRSSSSSLWKPPTAKLTNAKYYINRNKNHMIPIYMTTSYRGMRKITEVCKVQGDIHAMEQDLKKKIEETTGKVVASQVNELVGCIHFKGDYVTIVKQYLLEKGF